MYHKPILLFVLQISSFLYSSHQCYSNDPYVECKNSNHFRIEKYYYLMHYIVEYISHHES